ncbi:MAG: lysylphosphatidylglycerol synthase domain-containing protein, partial [Actinoallomurus sp.]
SVMAVPGVPTGSVGSLVALYLLGATAGAAVPMPAGVGSTEAALIAALATVHIPAAQAATGVFLFRIMTFWAPVPAGIMSTRWLRRRGGL